MIKNIKGFLKESEEKRRKFLRSLSLKRGIKILENLISSRLLTALTHRHKDSPVSLEKALKHARFSR